MAAEDLVQETLLAALESRSGPVKRRRPWLASVARRLAARGARGEIRRRDRELGHGPPDGVPGTDELVAAAESAELVASVARGLPEPYRRTILEHFLAGLAVQEIARRSGEKADTTRWRLRRGLELMREELERRDGGAAADGRWWMYSLAPLAALPERLVPGTTSAGMASAAALTLPSALIPMKALLSVAAAVLCFFGWLAFDDAAGTGPPKGAPATGDTAPEYTGPGDTEMVAAGMGESASSDSQGPALEGPLPKQRVLAAEAAGELPSAQAIGGRVVDLSGDPIEGAVLYLMELDSDSKRTGAEGDLRTESQKGGEFLFEAGALTRWRQGRSGDLSLGVVANGFLRETLSEVPIGDLAMEVVLSRGEFLQGRVVDPDGRGIPGLLLLAHGSFRGGNHVSPSRVLRRGSALNLAGPDSTYHQSLAESSSRGEVEFTGLAPGAYTVRSLDPGWMIVEPTQGRAGDSGVTWIAEARFGVSVIARVGGVDARELEEGRRPKLKAAFRVEVELEGGGSIDTGQWVGGGSGSASFSLMKDADPRIDMAEVVAARFYGTATVAGEEVEWTAERQVLGRGDAQQASRVFVDFEGQPVAREDEGKGPPRDSVIELDVRYAGSGAPFTGRLGVAWQVLGSGGVLRQDRDRAVPLGGGRYRLELPSGKAELRVSDGRASGSLEPWASEVVCSPGETQLVFAELTQGGAVEVMRPLALEGEWCLRASYRPEGAAGESAEWFGSWNYSTDEDTLRLTALKPAQWRFELRAGRGDTEPMAIRVVTIREGTDLIVAEGHDVPK